MKASVVAYTRPINEQPIPAGRPATIRYPCVAVPAGPAEQPQFLRPGWRGAGMSTTIHDARITAYFGDAVLQAGFMPLPHLFLRHYRELGLSHVQAMFVLQLMEIAWDFAHPPTTVTKLAQRMDVGHRTIQACSRDLHALGLIDIYDQYDAGGAQVENGYDLSPLFRRLAAFAPVERPGGDLRSRRPRSRSGTTPPSPPSVIDTTPVHQIAPAPRGPHHLPTAGASTVPPLPTAGLNTELKNPRKNRSRKHQAKQTGAGVGRKEPAQEHGPGGQSLRRKNVLTAAVVEQSRAVLECAGVNRNVAAAAAGTLDPAESWALWCYARGAGLGPAWLAAQVYDFQAQQPQPAGLAPRYDGAGQALAVLPFAVATAVLAAVDGACPDDLPAAEAALGSALGNAAVLHALHAVWLVMAEQRVDRRAGRARARPPSPAPPPPLVFPGIQQVGVAAVRPPPSGLVGVWATVLAALRPQVPSGDWQTWLAPTLLLELTDATAVVGTANMFVCQEVTDHYLELIQGALQGAVGRPVQVTVVVAAATAAVG